jgi:hypothetical protein
LCAILTLVSLTAADKADYEANEKKTRQISLRVKVRSKVPPRTGYEVPEGE